MFCPLDKRGTYTISLLTVYSSKNKKADPLKNRLQSNKVPFGGLSSNEIANDLKSVSKDF
jgi:hypothetical protein